MNWIEHDAGGAVLMVITSQDKPRPLLGGAVVPADRLYNPEQTRVIDGAPVDFGPRPSVHHEMDTASQSWVLVGTTALELAQAAKWSDIKAERDRREADTFPYMGKQLQCDVVSVLRMTGAKEAAMQAIAIGMTFSETWTCADNSLLPVDADAVLGMLPALAIFSSGLHSTARTLREQIYAEDATEVSVAAVTWPAA